MTSATPLNILDEQYLHLDREPEPWSVHFEVRMEGHIDGERLQAATATAAQRHPIARARLGAVAPTDVRYRWEISEQLDEVPLQESSGDLVRMRERLLSSSVDLSQGPPFALALVHAHEGDTLILNLHHAAGDGIAAARLMRSILDAYAGSEHELPETDPLELREVQKLAGPDGLSDRASRAMALAEHLTRLTLPPTRVVGDGGSAADGYGFSLSTYTSTELGQLMQSRRGTATLNDVLLAALALTIRDWNDLHGESGDRVSIMMPVNLRPPEWRSEVVGNYATYVTVPVHSIALGDLDAAIDAVAEATGRIKQEGTAGLMVDLLAAPSLLPAAVKQRLQALIPLTGNRVVDSAVLSNLGRLDGFGNAGAVKEAWFSPPGRMPLGASFGVATLNDRLHLTLRYRRALFGADAAERFQALLRDTLLGADRHDSA